MAASPDGRFLYALLEGPVWDADRKDFEKTEDGREFLRILEFDVQGEKFTGRHWRYVLEQNGLAIGDFNMISETEGLVIERDNGAGRASEACKAEPAADCFATPAKLKRVYKIQLGEENVGKAVRKIGYIDLLAIKDPNGLAKQGGKDGIYDMPFVTIENVDRVDDTHIIVGNDNNFPFSAGRNLDKVDDNEFVLLEVGDFLKAE